MTTIFGTICTAFCQSGAVQCSNGQCIPSSLHCDGTQHCTNGSDEIGCGKLLTKLYSLGSHAFNILTFLLQFVQLLVKVEHFGAPIISVSAPLIAVMELVTALMAVMRLDAVSLYIPTTVAWYSSSVISGMWQSIYLILYQTFQEMS